MLLSLRRVKPEEMAVMLSIRRSALRKSSPFEAGGVRRDMKITAINMQIILFIVFLCQAQLVFVF